MCFRVKLNIHEPLLLCKIPHIVPTTDQSYSFKPYVEFKYQRLLEFCFNYGILDHSTKDYNLHIVIQY